MKIPWNYPKFLESMKLSIETLTVTHDLLQIPENPLI